MRVQAVAGEGRVFGGCGTGVSARWAVDAVERRFQERVETVAGRIELFGGVAIVFPARAEAAEMPKRKPGTPQRTPPPVLDPVMRQLTGIRKGARRDSPFCLAEICVR